MSNRLNNNADLHTCEGIVLDSGDGEFIVKGSVRSNISNPTVMFWAANLLIYNRIQVQDYHSLTLTLLMKIHLIEERLKLMEVNLNSELDSQMLTM